MFHKVMPAIAIVAVAVTPAAAATPRDLLTTAAFQSTDKKQAEALVNQALSQANATLTANPNDREGKLQQALAIGYRAKLTKTPGDAKTSHRLVDGLVAANPRDAEFQLAMAGWHLDAVAAGFFVATLLGAKKDVGLAALDRAVALGGDRAFFKSMAAMMRIRANPDDIAGARSLAEQAAIAPTPTALDRIGQREAQAMLPTLRAGDGKGAEKLARLLLPFGRIH